MITRLLRIGGWHIETIFLGCATIFLGGYFSQLSILFPDRAGINGSIFAIWGICVIIGKLLLHWRLPTRDKRLFPVMMFLVGWGLLNLARLTPLLAIRQSIWLIVAFCLLMIFISSPVFLRWLTRFSWWIAGGAVILLLTTFVVGVHPSLPIGAPTLWLSLNRLFIQPAELLKVVLVGCFAVQIAHKRWWNILFLWGMVIGLFMLQRDFGVAILFAGVLFQLAYLAGIQWRILFISIILGFILAIFGFFLLPIIRLRVEIWLNPWVDVSGDSYQLVQSLFAFADGGIWGRGLGLSDPTLIPLAHSDFIFSAIAEEWGLVGVCLIMTCLGIITERALSIGKVQSLQVGQFLAWGIGAMFITQNVMIMGGALRIMPLTGMPLTFVSYGGSSLVVSMIMVGVLLRLSADNEIKNVDNTRIKWHWYGILVILGVIFCVAFYWAVLWI